MWADEDWRGLSMGAQHLYMLLLSHPTLTYAGVADWRPGRLAAMTEDRTAEQVRGDAHELWEARFIAPDDGTEEVLVRSFVKHDGLLKQPKLAVSMANAYAAVASPMIREVIAYEVQKLHERHPDLSAWGAKQVQTILGAKASRIESFTPRFTPGFTPTVTPPVRQSLGEPTTTATATEASLLPDRTKKPSIRLPKDWVPTSAHYERAKQSGIDITAEVERFKLHAETHDRHAANWNAAFTTWLLKAKPSKGGGSDWAMRL